MTHPMLPRPLSPQMERQESNNADIPRLEASREALPGEDKEKEKEKVRKEKEKDKERREQKDKDKEKQDEEKMKDYPMGLGSPGDFLFSDVPKPEAYLHTFRDMHSREHIVMLTQLNEGRPVFLPPAAAKSFS